MQRTILSLGGYRFELHLAVTIGVDEYPAEATGQEFAALIGATCDDLIAGQQPYPAARTVAVPTTATNGEHGEAGFDVELEFGECPTVGLAIGANRHLHDDLVGITEREPEDRMDILVLLDEPDHRLRLIADVLGRLRKLEQAAERRRVGLTARGPQHPELESVLHFVEAILELAHLGGQTRIAKHERRVGEPDGDLGDVLHLDEDVDRPIQIGDERIVSDDRRRPFVGGGELPQAGDAVRRPAQEQGIARHDDQVAADVGDPLPLSTHCHHPHAGLHGQFVSGQWAVSEVRALRHEHPVRDLLGLGQVGDQFGRDTDLVGDDPGDVDGVVGHPFDRRDDLENRRHALGFTGVAHRKDADAPHVLNELAEGLLEPADLLGHVGIAEVERCVGEVDHQLGAVLRLGEHLPEISGSVIHQRSPVPIMQRPQRRGRESG